MVIKDIAFLSRNPPTFLARIPQHFWFGSREYFSCESLIISGSDPRNISGSNPLAFLVRIRLTFQMTLSGLRPVAGGLSLVSYHKPQTLSGLH